MPTPTLRELQSHFWRALAAEPGKSSAEVELLDTIEPSASLDRRGRLQVYVDAYFWRLQQALRETFPRVAARVGAHGDEPDRFHELAAEYLRRHPSQHPSISYVGKLFPEFLRQRDDVPPYLSDLAHLEWTQAMVFEADDAIPMATAALHAIAPHDWPGVRFRPIPGLRIVSFQYPVHRLWRDETAAIDAPQPTRLRVWRTAELTVRHAVIEEREALALRSMTSGADFATICEAFADLPDEQAAREAIALLLRWLEDGIIAADEYFPHPAE